MCTASRASTVAGALVLGTSTGTACVYLEVVLPFGFCTAVLIVVPHRYTLPLSCTCCGLNMYTLFGFACMGTVARLCTFAASRMLHSCVLNLHVLTQLRMSLFSSGTSYFSGSTLPV